MSKFLDRFRYFKQKGETAPVRTCQTTNRAAARAAPATPGICTARTA